jgi:uncharacterized tellurite resistance protein B-like protein
MRDASGLVLVGLSSRLLEAFAPAELQFVIGHELGHAAFDHFGIPMPHTDQMQDMAGPIVSRRAALDLYVWCRLAELSADRVGLVCTGDPGAACSAFFKLASGVASQRIRPDLGAFAEQVHSLASAPQARAAPRRDDESLDCFSTHPYSPVRVRALNAFAQSRIYREAAGAEGGGFGEDDLEAVIERDLDLMLPTYLEEKTAQSELLRGVLLSAGILVAAASGEIDRREIDALRALLGAEGFGHEAGGQFDPSRAAAEFDERARRAVPETPPVQRAWLVEHLTIVAAADGGADEAEIAMLERIAVALGVSAAIVAQTLETAVQPLD